MNIIIVRHGETDWNVEGRYGGQKDIPLNSNGIKQALETKEKLKDIKFDKVYSSPLIRAYKTAEIICDGNNEIITDSRIMEKGIGDLEGKLKSEVDVVLNFNDPNERRFNIEPITDFRARIKSFFDDITQNVDAENILIVTHAGVGIYARCYFEGEPIDGNYMNYKMKNCDVLEYSNYSKQLKKTRNKKIKA